MGCFSSAPTKEELRAKENFNKVEKAIEEEQKRAKELDFLERRTHFDVPTLERLHTRYKEIDETMDDDNVIVQEELARGLGLKADNLIVNRIFSCFDSNNLEQFNFRNFCFTLSRLSMKSTLDEKIALSFELMDVNGDGCIESDELKQMLRAALDQQGIRLSENNENDICLNTFALVDTNKDNKIQKEEYEKFAQKRPEIVRPFYVDVPKLLQYDFDRLREKRSSLSVKKRLTHGALPTELASVKGENLKNGVDEVVTIDTVDKLGTIHVGK